MFLMVLIHYVVPSFPQKRHGHISKDIIIQKCTENKNKMSIFTTNRHQKIKNTIQEASYPHRGTPDKIKIK